jgi:hypothetical protein
MTGPKVHGDKRDPRKDTIKDTPDNAWPLDNCPPAGEPTLQEMEDADCMFCMDTGYTPLCGDTANPDAVRGYCPRCPQGNLHKQLDAIKSDKALPKSVVEPHITSFACGYCRDTRLLPDTASASGQKKCHHCATEFESLDDYTNRQEPLLDMVKSVEDDVKYRTMKYQPTCENGCCVATRDNPLCVCENFRFHDLVPRSHTKPPILSGKPVLFWGLEAHLGSCKCARCEKHYEDRSNKA